MRIVEEIWWMRDPLSLGLAADLETRPELRQVLAAGQGFSNATILATACQSASALGELDSLL